MNAVAPASSPPPRRRWPRLLLAVLLLIGLPAGYYFYASWALKSDIARALDETDALDPRWRYEDMEADSKSYPDAENSAQHMIKVRQLMARNPWPSAHKDYGPVFDHLPPPAQLNPQQIALIRECFDNVPEALVEARKLKDMPHGRFAARWDPSGLWILLPNQNTAREVGELLKHDALLKVQFGDPESALESCGAHLYAA